MAELFAVMDVMNVTDAMRLTMAYMVAVGTDDGVILRSTTHTVIQQNNSRYYNKAIIKNY